ncbi:Ppx/GppA phosphatase family protein [Mucilaginibacter ginkgonis]|uniref:Exopolyphosphatase n=1 Tax=Mucilaginibacter ginkgonis TaxID=2682091 RepID=A0A6I4HXC9_9SPHI|nr:exopolyphosphatase [Mucilaginibacter ginkgonis]QQL51020.1 exopolyphosphatase [Mucilaginibacter ginkgonis]
MPRRIAVMDLGTNTFHLLIAEKDGAHFKTRCHLENSTRLGEDGMPDGYIKASAFERGVAALVNFKKAIDKFGVTDIKAIGTSALRSAKNGTDFIQQVKSETGIEIVSVDGETEAGYIYQGVRSTGILPSDISLILDIGGGSIEFIICDNQSIFWKRSYEIGAARLMKQFHHSDPISADEIADLERYLDEVLPDMYAATTEHNVTNLVGSSGAFETFAELIESQKGNDFDMATIKACRFDQNELMRQLADLICSTHPERAANKHIPHVRTDMIVVSSVVTRYLIQKLNIRSTAMSVYSLKEGVLAEMLR